MVKNFPHDRYRCKQSGLTDIALSEFDELMKATSRSVKDRKHKAELIRYFRDGGFGDNYVQIRDNVLGHLENCFKCQQQYLEIVGESQ